MIIAAVRSSVFTSFNSPQLPFAIGESSGVEVVSSGSSLCFFAFRAERKLLTAKVKSKQAANITTKATKISSEDILPKSIAEIIVVILPLKSVMFGK